MDSINSIATVGVAVGVALAGFITLGLILSRLYKKTTKEKAFVRTGWRGEKVIKDGGCIVVPMIQEITDVNLRTLRLRVSKKEKEALITKDRMRVDIGAEFFVRVKDTLEDISNAARTLGQRTTHPDQLKEVIEPKFIDALRAVAAGMTMNELHEQRGDFVQKVQNSVSEDIGQNGLELETVSLTGLDQTAKEFFDETNAFDSAGLKKLTEEIEFNRKAKNDIEQDTQVLIDRKNYEAEVQKLQIAQDQEFARLEQVKMVANENADQGKEIATVKAIKEKEAREAEINAERQVEEAKIIKQKSVQLAEQQKHIEISAKSQEEINAERQVEEAKIIKQKSVQLAEQQKHIEVSNKSQEESQAKRDADFALAESVKAEEQVVTVRQTEVAERKKAIEIIEAKEHAEKEAFAITIAAEADKVAAKDKADAITVAAQAKSDAVKILAEADEKKYLVDAEGVEKMNLAKNQLAASIIEMELKLAIVGGLPAIMKEVVEPVKHIDEFKVLNVDGLNGMFGGNGSGNGGSTSGNGGSDGFVNEVVGGALKYQMMNPLVGNLLKTLGITDHTQLNSFLETLGDGNVEKKEEPGVTKPKPTKIPGKPKGKELGL